MLCTTSEPYLNPDNPSLEAEGFQVFPMATLIAYKIQFADQFGLGDGDNLLCPPLVLSYGEAPVSVCSVAGARLLSLRRPSWR
jgi:hypothetical protein